MSIRIHTTNATTVALSICNPAQLADLYDLEDVEGGLVIEDTGSLEALLLQGTNEELAALANDILARLNSPQLNP